jgi:2',3'-cyclic-nucleotide 2'-phosphodiesterase (5'-nucleotidase family)
MKNALAALAAVLSLGYGPVVACPDGEHHQQTRFQAPPTALTRPSRPLVWGELNIIHTTDTHGWLLGHQKSSPPEPNYRLVLSSQRILNANVPSLLAELLVTLLHLCII